MQKCEHCGKCIEGRIQYINSKKVCDYCYFKIKKKNNKKRKNIKKCKSKNCNRPIGKNNNSGYCWYCHHGKIN